MSQVTDNWFLALDGDDIGRHLELHMLTEDADGLRAFASAFEDVLDQLFRRIKDIPSIEVLLRGGDSLLLAMPEAEIKAVLDHIHATVSGTEFTFSGGYGRTMRDAYLALKLAKATGKDKISTLNSEKYQ